MSDGGAGEVHEPLELEAALRVHEHRLTSEAPEARRDLDVHGQLQAEQNPAEPGGTETEPRQCLFTATSWDIL